MPTDAALYADWQASGMGRKEFYIARLASEMSYGAWVGRMWRLEQKLIQPRPELFISELPTPWRFDFGDCVATGDWQLPTTDYGFGALPLAIGARYLKKPRRLIIGGDFLNADAFSTYDSDIPTPSFQRERAVARQVMYEILTVFDEVYWFMGNHERRVGKRTNGAIDHEMLKDMVSSSPRLKVSPYGYMTLNTRAGLWRVTHNTNYSVNKLIVADQLAQKFQCNVLCFHQHHLTKGMDKYKRYVVIDGGGVFDPSQMGYVVMDDSKSPEMVPGFTLLRDGYSDVFGQEPYTNWNEWLPEKPKTLKARAA